jgi:hypothetical protein
MCTTLCDKVCHDITEILLKVALNTIKQTEKLYNVDVSSTPHHQRKSLEGPGIFLLLAMGGTHYFLSHDHCTLGLEHCWWLSGGGN